MKTSERGRSRDKRGTSPGQARDKGQAVVLGPTKPGVVLANLSENSPDTTGYEVAGQLRDLLKNEDLPASARVTAARTLAEIEGLIGRHQAAPERGATAPLSSLSRDQLIEELGRLRTLVDLGLVR